MVASWPVIGENRPILRNQSSGTKIADEQSSVDHGRLVAITALNVGGCDAGLVLHQVGYSIYIIN